MCATEETVVIELESDLASLSSRAAIALDNLVIGGEVERYALCTLADTIVLLTETPAESSEPALLLDPSTAIVMNHAIADAKLLPTALTTVEQLLQEASSIGERLREVSKDPPGFLGRQREDVEKMRSFCLALSKQACAYRESVADRQPTHPFRR